MGVNLALLWIERFHLGFLRSANLHVISYICLMQSNSSFRFARVLILLIGFQSFLSIAFTQTTLFPFPQNKKWGYMDAKGKIMITPVFDRARDFAGDFAPANQNGKWGIIDREGKWMLEPGYNEINISKDGSVARVLIQADDYEYDAGLVETSTGKVLIPVGKYAIEVFQEGLAVFSTLDEIERNTYGYLNTKGEIAIPVQFEEALSFSEGRARVYNAETGDFVIDPKGETVFVYSGKALDGQFIGGLLPIQIDGMIRMVDRDGNSTFSGPYEDVGLYTKLEGGLIPLKQGGLWGFTNEKGDWVIEPQLKTSMDWDPIDAFSEGLVAAFKEGQWGYVDTQGNWAIPPGFEHARPFIEGHAQVTQGGKWGLINKEGKLVVPCQYNYVHPVRENLIMIFEGTSTNQDFWYPPGKYGYLDTEGNTIWPLQE